MSVRPNDGDVGLVLGSGGAARAAAWALGELGVAQGRRPRAQRQRAGLPVEPLCSR